MTFSTKQFPDFFQSIHKHPPFPWQIRMLEQVIASGWPKTICLPTASGKTAVMDIAVFALALQAITGQSPRTAPRRIALIVDRRIVVDSAFDRARLICKKLIDARDGILKKVADALHTLGGEEPLQAAQLRGGIYREDRWARTPAQPVILCSTVDQVGSRLLFRGYGISTSMWPVHAGLMGNDTLLILDEAHCSEPFRQTLEWISRLRQKSKSPLPLPFAAVTMTATPRNNDDLFKLNGADCNHPILRMRTEARKLATLIPCINSGDADIAKLVITSLKPYTHDGATILVIVNRVATARAIREALAKMKHDSILLTGRCRAIERDHLLENHRTRLMAGRDRDVVKNHPPLIVVATQCVEVGADLDADTLITECCSLDALRQRLGRLDRLGQRKESEAVVFIRDNQIGSPEEPADDPIYGQALSRTWHWLIARAENTEVLDLGTTALTDTVEAPVDLTAPSLDSPLIFPAYCDLWSQTGPQPAASPEPAIFLHGPQRGLADVRLIWRADLGDSPEKWADIVSLCPPVAAESLPLPFGLAKEWLAQTKNLKDNDGDIEGIIIGEHLDKKECRPALHWAGPNHSSVVRDISEISPGDTLVIPATYGGCDQEGWNPNFAGRVTDIADLAREYSHRARVIRLHPIFISDSESWGSELVELATFTKDEWPQLFEERVKTAVCESDLPLNRSDRFHIVPHPSGTGLILQAKEKGNFTDEDATSGHSRAPLSLDIHVRDVAQNVGSISQSIGLSEPLIHDLELAGCLHDIGKADPRFQAWIAGGSRLQARQHGLLAKSSGMPTNPSAMRATRLRAGYPIGGRHELLSVRLAESCEEILKASHDRDLVLHLIASHHGHCRPFAPVVFDDRPLMVEYSFRGQALTSSTATCLERLDSGITDRFWKLTDRYGWWGLAALESCLRLADHRASENPTTTQEQI